MKFNVRGVVTFVAGAVLGGLAATHIANKRCEREKAAYALELHRTYSAILEESGVTSSVIGDAVVNEKPVDEVVNVPVSKVITPDLESTFQPVDCYADYTQYASTVVVTPPAATTDDIPGIKPDIRFITIEDYGEIPTFAKTTLIYHDNGELTDENTGMLVENWADTVGHAWQQHFVNGTADELYIRNSRLKIDYEIVHERDVDP